MERQMKRLYKIVELYKGNKDEFGHAKSGEIVACRHRGQRVIEKLIEDNSKELSNAVFSLLAFGDFRHIKVPATHDINIKIENALKKLDIAYTIKRRMTCLFLLKSE